MDNHFGFEKPFFLWDIYIYIYILSFFRKDNNIKIYNLRKDRV